MSGAAKAANDAVAKPTYSGPIFDGDNHIYEPWDCSSWNDYMPAELKKDWKYAWKKGTDGEFALYVGPRKVETSAGYFGEGGLVSPPGRLHEWLQAMKQGKEVEIKVKATPDMFNPVDRLKKMDEFGVDGAIMFIGTHVSTFGYLASDPKAANQIHHGYNTWFHEAWGYAYKDRIYATPVLALNDLDWAVEEAKLLAKRGARVVVMPLGPVNGKAPADPAFDRVWTVLNEAKINVAFHVSEAAYMHDYMGTWGEVPLQSRQRQSAFTWMNFYSERPVIETLTSFVFYNFFERFPNIKLTSVENGAEWVPQTLIKMDKSRGMAKNGYWPCGQLKTRPSAIFKENIFVVAYPEDDIKSIIEQCGTGRFLMMGSDYPHAEGVPVPADFATEACDGLTAAETSAVMHENGRRFLPKAA
jgi:predicted TIM-barrel fold metal-dependent hydrolase